MTLPAAFLTTPFAHRGLHDRALGRPENSRAAFAAAISAGYGIELDIQAAADSTAMVFHDDDLDRLTAELGPVRARAADVLGAILLNGGDEGIPTLAEVCDLVAGRVPLLIEIKDQDGALGAHVGPLEQAVADVLRGYAGPFAVMSFNPHSMVAMARLLPGAPRGLTTCVFDPAESGAAPETCARLSTIADYSTVGACFLSHDHHDLANPRVAQLKAEGAAILCWTIRTPAQEAAARRIAHTITFEGYAPPLA